MQQVVIDKPYRFVPPYPGEFWARLYRPRLPRYLRRTWGIESYEIRGLERVRQSIDAGHGILLAPNHPRPCDPLAMGLLSAPLGRLLYAMASWHVFLEGGRFRAWLARRLGAFSVHRWGMDREALKAAIQVLAEAHRPLIVFAEGHITRTNDRLTTLLEGTAFIARAAARQRAKATPPGQVVIHPVALKYFFEGNLAASVEPVLDDIETRLSWRPQRGLPLEQRITKVGDALLALKEIEYLGAARNGPVGPRLQTLIDALLEPLEKEWLGGRRETAVVERTKLLRTAILPDMVSGDISQAERDRRWRQLADIYLAQQLSCYPPDYLAAQPSPERILETVERFEEDLTDVARIHRPLHLVLQVGEALEISPARDKSGGEDPLMHQFEARLRDMIASLNAEPRRSQASSPLNQKMLAAPTSSAGSVSTKSKQPPARGAD
jgi:1-acyl-sn-glycerol-3-phosphate acyltransferase